MEPLHYYPTVIGIAMAIQARTCLMRWKIGELLQRRRMCVDDVTYTVYLVLLINGPILLANPWR